MLRPKPAVTIAILAAGSGRRMNSATTKQKMKINGESVLLRSVKAFEKSELVDDIIIVVKEDELDFASAELSGVKKIRNIVVGGNTRAESAANAFGVVSDSCVFFGVHDAARCLIETEDIDTVISDAFIHGAATASTPIYDTVKEIDENQNIKYTHNRNTMRFVQTPQVFEAALYKKALGSLDKIGAENVSDDNMLMESIGVPVHCSATKATNIKITTPADVEYAEFLLKKEKEI